jgi:hypothetical protein
MYLLSPLQKFGPLYEDPKYKDLKDPCPVFDGSKWHIYGSGGNVRTEVWQILHATSPSIEGPWTPEPSVQLNGVTGEHVAAPGVIFDDSDKTFHMFVQTDFLAIGGGIEYLTSTDGSTFNRMGLVLSPILDTEEAGLYDPHPAVIKGKKYLSYSGTPRVTKFENKFISQPDIFLAESITESWEGPWVRRGKILDHKEIEAHHNHREHPEYEWGIEGPQLIDLDNDLVLLNATCFLSHGRFGTRQRVFFAISYSITGPYKTLGPIIDPQFGPAWETGENGHAAGFLHEERLQLFYQARSGDHVLDPTENNWRYGRAIFNVSYLSDFLRKDK